MKHLAILTTIAASAWSAELTFSTGQAARLVIGQSTFTGQEPGTTQVLLGGPHGVAWANDMLFVVDANKVGANPSNHRVMIYRDLSRMLPGPTDEIPQGNRCNVCVGAATSVLGQTVFDKGDFSTTPARSSLRSPTGISTDGNVIAVADTDNNRVLIWRSIPQSNNAGADVVLGQPDFTRNVVNNGQGSVPTQNSMRGPQGVWVRNGRLFVADTGNNRVLIWNSIPTSNHANADVVLGQPDFGTFVQLDLTKTTIDAKATTLLTPVSVTTDGTRMLVADLGHNRVLMWNSIPTRNQQPADLVLGQKTMETAVANNNREVCEADGKDTEGNDTFPSLCEASMEFPRFALSDGRYLFIADGGNDRILVYDNLPTRNGQPADVVLGQINNRVNLISDSADPRGVASSGAVRTPLGLAWDGRNLYTSDPFNRRVMVFTLGERKVPNTGVRNAAQREVFAVGSLALAGEVQENDEITFTVTLKDYKKEYKYKVKKEDRFQNVVNGLVTVINTTERGGDQLLFATPNIIRNALIFTAKNAGAFGNDVEIQAAVSTGATIQVTTSGPKLSGGQDAALIAPGTIVTVFGEDLAGGSAGADPAAVQLPTTLANTEVYFDGIRAPLYSVSPTEIQAQIPWEVTGSQSINAIVRSRRASGEVSVTSAIAVPIIEQNPGVFAEINVPDPRPGIIMHGSAFATGTISVDGSVRVGDICTVTIAGERQYQYIVQDADTLASIRDRLIEEINKDEEVEAFAAAAFTRIRLRAKKRGADGNNIEYGANTREGDQVILTATTPRLCCANEGRVTEQNPALPGQTIILTATGLGLLKDDEHRKGQNTGLAYAGDANNDPREFVSSLAGGKTANVLSASLKPGSVGIYEIILELNSDLPTDPATQVTIAQDVFVSNIVTFALKNPNDEPQ